MYKKVIKPSTGKNNILFIINKLFNYYDYFFFHFNNLSRDFFIIIKIKYILLYFNVFNIYYTIY